MRFAVRVLEGRGVDRRRIQVSLERNMQCGAGVCGHCQLGELLLCRDGPVVDYVVAARSSTRRSCDEFCARPRTPRPTLAVWKFASCDGCQLSLLDCEDELLTVAEELDIAHFLELSSATVEGPYDLSLVEGSVTTEEDVERIHRIRDASEHLVTIGACATAGGVQALRTSATSPNSRRRCTRAPSTSTPSRRRLRSRHTCGGLRAARLPHRPAAAPRGDRSLPGRTPPRRAEHQRVQRMQEAWIDVRHGRRRHTVPRPGHACRLRRTVSGPFPRLLRRFGPTENPNISSLAGWLRRCGMDDAGIGRVFSTFNVAAPGFAEGRRHGR